MKKRLLPIIVLSLVVLILAEIAWPIGAQGPQYGPQPIWVKADGWYNVRREPWGEIIFTTWPGAKLGALGYRNIPGRGRWVRVVHPVAGWIIWRGVADFYLLPELPAPTPTPTPTPEPYVRFVPERNYLVQPGDTLTSISIELGVSIRSLVCLNGIKNPNRIWVGQWLKY